MSNADTLTQTCIRLHTESNTLKTTQITKTVMLACSLLKKRTLLHMQRSVESSATSIPSIQFTLPQLTGSLYFQVPTAVGLLLMPTFFRTNVEPIEQVKSIVFNANHCWVRNVKDMSNNMF